MKVFTELHNPEVITMLQQGAVGVIPTDTLYGLVASVHIPVAIERVYRLRHRSEHKPCIVLISGMDDITDKAAWSVKDYEVVGRYWPGKVSIILPATGATPAYLHRGVSSIAYRQPDHPELLQLLQQTGLLVAPSANLEGRPPAATIKEAQAYFGNNVDFYVDAGELQAKPSTLIKTHNGLVQTLRAGAVAIP